jgi:hypothetical protein
MNSPDPRAEARNRANRRLRRMTIGTGALAVASVGLFGATAAFTNDGTPTTAGTLALARTRAGSTSSDTDSGTATPSTTSSSSSSTTAPAVTSTSGTAHASTGGS